MMKDIDREIEKYAKSLGEYMAKRGLTRKPFPKIVLDGRQQDGLFISTGYFDPSINGIRLFTYGRALKDILRTLAHELVHWRQQVDGDIERSGYSGSKITEDKNLVRLEAEAYLKGNMAFRSWTEDLQSGKVSLNESGRRKIRKNDKKETVPDRCPSCGAKVATLIQGEPIFKCSNPKCGRFFGALPFINENSLISPEEAEREGFAVPKSGLSWENGEFMEPRNTGIAYKVFYLKNGKLYPPMVANDGGQDTPIGVWLPASSPNVVGYTEKEHRPQVMAGGKGTRTGKAYLAFRPGWHMGEIPYAKQFMKRGTINGREIWPAELVWAEVEYSNDVDYQERAMSYGNTKDGKFMHSRAGLPAIPKGGSYRYRTNPNPDTVPWVIAGAMKVKRLLSFDEVADILKKNGVTPPIPMTDAEYRAARDNK